MVCPFTIHTLLSPKVTTTLLSKPREESTFFSLVWLCVLCMSCIWQFDKGPFYVGWHVPRDFISSKHENGTHLGNTRISYVTWNWEKLNSQEFLALGMAFRSIYLFRSYKGGHTDTQTLVLTHQAFIQKSEDFTHYLAFTPRGRDVIILFPDRSCHSRWQRTSRLSTSLFSKSFKS